MRGWKAHFWRIVMLRSKRWTARSWIVLAGALVLIASGRAVAQEAAPPSSDPILAKFSFAGGTLPEFLVALSDASRSDLNIVVRGDAQSVSIPEVELRNVHVDAVIEAVLFDTGVQVNIVRAESGSPVRIIAAPFPFPAAGNTGRRPPTMHTNVISLTSLRVTPTEENVQPLLRVIDAALGMGPDPDLVEINYHAESGLLIVMGTESQLEMIHTVVARYSESSKMRRDDISDLKQSRRDMKRRVQELELSIAFSMDEREFAAMEAKEKRAQVEAGVATRGELARAELAVKEAEATVLKNENALRSWEERLELLQFKISEIEGSDAITKSYDMKGIARLEGEVWVVLATISTGGGPEIALVSIESDRMSVSASSAQHRIIAAVIGAMRAAAKQD